MFMINVHLIMHNLYEPMKIKWKLCMDTCMHKTMASVASLEKIEIIRSQEFLKKMIILGPKTAILGPQFCRILVLGPHFWWSGGARAPLDPPLLYKGSGLKGPVSELQFCGTEMFKHVS